MSEKILSWFHCGRCGSLFQSPAGDQDDRVCPACGRNPSLGIEAPTSDPAPPQSGHSPDNDDPPNYLENLAKHPLRKRKRSYLMAKLVIGWSVVLLAIVFGARKLWPDKPRSVKAAVSQSPAASVVSEEDVAFLNENGPLCAQNFTNFLAAGTPEERSQFVLEPVITATRMERFYSLNPLPNIDPATLVLASTSVLHLPGRPAIETLWRFADGRLLDAVFIREKGEWRLDWDHFARFSDYPWALFLAGSGPEQGDFRLLVRERLAEARKNEDSISVVFYGPRFGDSAETGFQSPEFLIKRDTKNGRLLDAAFKLDRSGGRLFGLNLPNPNPEGHIRVRVKVRRIEQDNERRFELEEVLACHWYSIEDPGVEIPGQVEK